MSGWNALKGLTLTLNSLRGWLRLYISFTLTPSPDCSGYGSPLVDEHGHICDTLAKLDGNGCKELRSTIIACPILFLSRGGVGPMEDTGG